MPIGNDNNIIEIIFIVSLAGAGYGDPHYKTMDCLSYTFAAAGEFTLFDIRSNQNVPIFTLQGRLGPGNNWPATTTKSLAFGIPNVEAYQVC